MYILYIARIGIFIYYHDHRTYILLYQYYMQIIVNEYYLIVEAYVPIYNN